jgi:hypothetical protein
MRFTFAFLFISAVIPAADSAPKPVIPPPAPYIVRILALGHEPDRKYKLLSNGFYEMLELDSREMPPRVLYIRLPTPAVVLPGSKPPAHIACGLQLNGVQETVLPTSIPPEDPLPLELEVVAPPVAGAKGPPEKSYKEIGEIKRTSESTSSLVILYNPAGRKTWDGVKPFVIDTSEKALPAGAMLVYNLCTDNLLARVGSPGEGTLAPGQSAFVRPQVNAQNYFDLKLVMQRNGEQVQLIDAAREFAPGARGLLVIYPQPLDRNTRGADFVLYLFPVDPQPEPVIAPPPAAAKGTKTTVVR